MNEDYYEERIGNDTIVIRPFRREDAEGLANLFNESEEGWPGGLTGGIPYTAERLLDEIKRMNALAHWILLLNGQIIGVCSTSEHWKDEKAAYVMFLNLHPKYHGRGLGRRLLFQGVKHIIKSGYERLDIHTWSGNLKAVPLYKKMGFFWVPGTHVYMQNYIPAVLNHPAAKPFFKKHPDWYANFKRDLKVEEDDLKYKGANVFVYCWEKNGEKLRVIIDREAFSISGIENDQITVTCWPSEHEGPAGFSQKVEWQVKNKTEKKIHCSLLVSAEEDIQIIEKPLESFTVEPHQTVTLEGKVRISAKPAKKDEDDPAHKIMTNLFVDGTLIPLATGIRVKQPVELQFDPAYFSCKPGSEGELKVTLKSNVRRLIRGVLIAVPHPMLQLTPLSRRFEIPKEGYAGAAFRIRVPENIGTKVMPLRFYAVVTAGKEKVRTEEKIYPIKVFTAGGVLAAIEGDGRTLALENEVARLTIGLHRGGRLVSFHGKLHETHYAASLHDALGPPFWPTEIERKDFRYEIFRENGAIRARLYADLETYEGLRVIKDVTLFPAAELVKIQYSFVNSSSKTKHDFQLQLGTYGKINEARIVIPLKQGIVSAAVNGDFPSWEADLPEKPEAFAETWFCLEYPRTGEVLGVLWHPENVVANKRGASELIFKPEIVKPQSSVTLKPVYLVGGFGTWRRVRELWRRMVCGQTRKEITYRRVVERSLVESVIEPSIMDVADRVKAKIVVTNNRGKTLSGDLRLKPPKGWTMQPQRFKIKDAKLKKPYEKTVTISPKRGTGLGAYRGSIRITTKLTTIESPFSLVVLGRKGTVKIGTMKEQEKEVFCIDNGRLLLKICPSLAGIAYSLVDKEKGVEHLLSSFPDRKPYGYENPWFGGIRLGVWKNRRFDKLYDEDFQCEKTERNGWLGVKVSTKPEKHVIDLKGITVEGYYLTKPGSNVIARILRINNQTSARMTFRAYMNTFVQVGGTIKNNVAYFRKGNEVSTRKRVREMARIVPDENWLQVTNEKTKDSLIMISTATERSRPMLQDWGLLGVNMAIDTHVLVDPDNPVEIVSYLILTDDPKAYRDYKILQNHIL